MRNEFTHARSKIWVVVAAMAKNEEATYILWPDRGFKNTKHAMSWIRGKNPDKKNFTIMRFWRNRDKWREVRYSNPLYQTR